MTDSLIDALIFVLYTYGALLLGILSIFGVAALVFVIIIVLDMRNMK